MNYYVAGFTGTGTVDDRVRPNGIDSLPAGTQWGCIDFRPLNRQTATNGWCVLATAAPIPNPGTVPGLNSLGTNLDAPISGAAKTLIESRFGVTLDPDTTTWRKLIKHLLTRKGSTSNDPTRWNDLAKRGGRNVIVLCNETIIDDSDD